jgi:beta-glucosidase
MTKWFKRATYIESLHPPQNSFCSIQGVTSAALRVVVVLGVMGLSLRALPNGSLAKNATPLWKDSTQPLEARVSDLVSRMTLQEKALQVCNHGPAIPRLGLPAYDYWNEALHGVARNGVATVFPQAIGMAASWDTSLLHEVADAIATEARAKNRAYAETHDGDGVNYTGLTFWTPNINIARDPRWGRNQETYGEDPFLTARLAVAFIRGLQGDDPKYLKAMACAKHFAVHSGPEALRHQFNAEPPERDLYETYLPQFEAAVREAHVGAVMGAYNRLYGKPVCASPEMLTDLLRRQWGFDGQVVSDCGAVYDMVHFHKYTPTFEEAAALAVKAGCDLSCGSEYEFLTNAVNHGLISEKQLDAALTRDLKVRFRLGMFDPPEAVPYAKIPVTENDTPEHGALALRMARESIVLLKNDALLPLNRARLHRLAIIGPNADSVPALLGNYFGTPSHPSTILAGIRQLAGAQVQVSFEPGCSLSTQDGDTNQSANAAAFEKAVAAAKSADAIVYVGGLDPALEGEDLHVHYDGFHGGDRTQIELPPVQIQLLKALHATGKPVVFVNCSGAAVAMPWVAKNIPVILQAWYPGQAGGTAVAGILFGDDTPSGKLPVTFYRSTEDLPPFTSYSMSNRTYRYFSGKPLFAFGHGLSYTRFQYKLASLDRTDAAPNETVRVSLQVANTGECDGSEVVQVYFRHVKSSVPQAHEALCGFRRVAVSRGAVSKVEIEVPVQQFRYWDVAGKRYIVEPGQYEILVGSASDDIRAKLPLRVRNDESQRIDGNLPHN